MYFTLTSNTVVLEQSSEGIESALRVPVIGLDTTVSGKRRTPAQNLWRWADPIASLQEDKIGARRFTDKFGPADEAILSS